MDRDSVQADLVARYRLRLKAINDVEAAARLGAPLLLNVTEEYARAAHKILVIGQETFGWSWNGNLKRDYPDYPQDWTRPDVATWGDFARQTDGVENLCEAYRIFSFSKYQGNRHSPFWTAFRQISGWAASAAMWTNLYRADFDGGSTAMAPADVRKLLFDQEQDLLLEELALLKPQTCIFLTGPNCDEAIADRLPGAHWMSILPDRKERQIARVTHPSLPEHSYRLYHPAYLRRTRKWGDIDAIRELVEQALWD